MLSMYKIDRALQEVQAVQVLDKFSVEDMRSEPYFPLVQKPIAIQQK